MLHVRKLLPPKAEIVGGKPTGSRIAVDLVCHDCGAGLVAGGGQSFDYMVCGRLDSRDPRYIHIRRPNTGKGTAGRGEQELRQQVIDAPTPKPNSVIECGRYGLG